MSGAVPPRRRRRPQRGARCRCRTRSGACWRTGGTTRTSGPPVGRASRLGASGSGGGLVPRGPDGAVLRARDSTRARRGATGGGARRGGGARAVRERQGEGYSPCSSTAAWVPHSQPRGRCRWRGRSRTGSRAFPSGAAGRCRTSSTSGRTSPPSSSPPPSGCWSRPSPPSSARCSSPTERSSRRWRAPARRAEKARRRSRQGRARRRSDAPPRKRAAIPSTLAESLGQALVPGGWIHQAVTVVTEDVVRAPSCRGGGGGGGTVAPRLAESDGSGWRATCFGSSRSSRRSRGRHGAVRRELAPTRRHARGALRGPGDAQGARGRAGPQGVPASRPPRD